jgi:16S rRNA (guanine966-N2)-methyltransferase
MRVIAGRARRTILKTPSGLSTRPTTDRIKETLFNMINNDLVDSRFLDLFSGSGGIGIEALSRGASFCVFVENNKEAIECIKENIEKTRFANESKILFKDVNAAIKELANGEKFDIIFMDPPYNMNIEKDILIDLKSAKLVDVNTIIIIEASIETEFDFISDIGYDILKIKEYKTNKHIFISIKN